MNDLEEFGLQFEHRAPRNVRRRMNFLLDDEMEEWRRWRMTEEHVQHVFERIEHQIPEKSARFHAVSRYDEFKMTLRFESCFWDYLKILVGWRPLSRDRRFVWRERTDILSCYPKVDQCSERALFRRASFMASARSISTDFAWNLVCARNAEHHRFDF